MQNEGHFRAYSSPTFAIQPGNNFFEGGSVPEVPVEQGLGFWNGLR